MTKRLKQRVTIGNETRWVTGYSQQELIQNAIILATGRCAAELPPAPPPPRLFAPYAANWFSLYKESCLKHTTLREYASILKKHLVPVFGDRDIRSITTDDVQRLMNAKANMSRKSIHEMVMVLGMVLESAVEDDLLPRNPARSKRLRNPSVKKSTREALTRDQVLDIILHLPCLTEERDRLFLALLLYTGMRRDEVLGLRWIDVDMRRKVIYVRRGVTYKGNQPIISTPKTAAAIRQIPLPSGLQHWLHPGKVEAYVIGGQSEPITEKTIIRMWQRISKTINLYGATPHVFRHTYMTFAQRASVPTKTLQAIGGYADLATLQNRYIHSQDEDMERARNAIEGMFCDTFVTGAKPANP